MSRGLIGKSRGKSGTVTSPEGLQWRQEDVGDRAKQWVGVSAERESNVHTWVKASVLGCSLPPSRKAGKTADPMQLVEIYLLCVFDDCKVNATWCGLLKQTRCVDSCKSHVMLSLKILRC
jgi:hypothetical protein